MEGNVLGGLFGKRKKGAPELMPIPAAFQPEDPVNYNSVLDYVVGLSDKDYKKLTASAEIYRDANKKVAKLLGIKENRLTAWLHEHGWTYRLNGRWVAKQEHIQGGRLIYKEAKYTDEKTGHEVYAPYCHITPKGLAKLARVFAGPDGKLAA